MKRILVIRGGGIGDFVVTLPVFELLRSRWSGAHIELLGQMGIAQLALKRRYLDAVRSADHGPFARFFAKDAELDFEWINYFRSFDLVVSYFFDPDHIFQNNLVRCGLTVWEGGGLCEGDVASKRWLLTCDPRIQSKPAARQLCSPLAALGLVTTDFSSRLYPSDEDLCEGRKMLRANEGRWVTLHPGSGGVNKNWLLPNWLELAEKIRALGFQPVIVGGEADGVQLDAFSKKFPDMPIIRNQALPVVAAVLQLCGRHVGHDTGISHIAAAVGAKSVLIFGVTDPEVWSPPNFSGRLIVASEGLANLSVETVFDSVRAEFCGGL